MTGCPARSLPAGSLCRVWQLSRHVRQTIFVSCSRLHHPRVAILFSMGDDPGHMGHKVLICHMERLHLCRLGLWCRCTLGVDLDGKLFTSRVALAPERQLRMSCMWCSGTLLTMPRAVLARWCMSANAQHLPQDNAMGSCAQDMPPLGPQQAVLGAKSIQRCDNSFQGCF